MDLAITSLFRPL